MFSILYHTYYHHHHKMTARYAKDQPAGFTNRIEKVAIVGVSQLPLELVLE